MFFMANQLHDIAYLKECKLYFFLTRFVFVFYGFLK